jgi:hypothetical protein
MPLSERHVDTALPVDQLNAANARAVISSTVPVPLILRYRGAPGSPLVAQFE